MEKGGGFDMSKLSMASKLLLIGGILLLVDSFLQWQRVCADAGPLGKFCVGAGGWSGNGGFAGVIMGLLLIAMLVWEGLQVGGVSTNLSVGVSASKLTAYLGFGAAAFGLLKFILAVSNHGAIFAWIGLVLILVVAYGSWMKFQEPEGAASPPAASGGDSGFTA